MDGQKEIDNKTKVIKFDTIKLPVISKKSTPCNHPQILLDPGYRVVECKKCNQIIDPFDYLMEWANGDRHLNETRKRIKREIRKINENLKLLRKEERNIKARIRRAKVIV
jgi:hypothetical protein